VIGPLAVFHCGKGLAWIYILAQLLAACLSCSIFAFVSGWGPLNPLVSFRDLNLTWPEAMRMWVTGAWRASTRLRVGSWRCVKGARTAPWCRRRGPETPGVVAAAAAAVPAGQPPSRLQTSDDENIQDVMSRVEKVQEERKEQRDLNSNVMNELADKQERKERNSGSGATSAV
jgi:hypothetical protein